MDTKEINYTVHCSHIYTHTRSNIKMSFGLWYVWYVDRKEVLFVPANQTMQATGNLLVIETAFNRTNFQTCANTMSTEQTKSTATNALSCKMVSKSWLGVCVNCPDKTFHHNFYNTNVNTASTRSKRFFLKDIFLGWYSRTLVSLAQSQA